MPSSWWIAGRRVATIAIPRQSRATAPCSAARSPRPSGGVAAAAGPGLIGALLVPTLLFSPVFEYEWNTDEFDRTVSPDTFTELEDSYALEVGNLVIDLTDLPWDGETVDLVARVDAGNIEIWIPPGVGLEGEASVDVGHVGAFGRESSGLGGPTLEFDTPGPAGTVVLDATVDLGNIDIQIVGR